MTAMSDLPDLFDYDAELRRHNELLRAAARVLRAGGWRRVTVTNALGRLGTDVVGVAADGRRWLMRCPRDPAGPSRPAPISR